MIFLFLETFWIPGKSMSTSKKWDQEAAEFEAFLDYIDEHCDKKILAHAGNMTLEEQAKLHLVAQEFRQQYDPHEKK